MNTDFSTEKTVCGRRVELRDGRLFVDGVYRFLKIGKPLRNFGDKADVEQLIADLDIIRAKNFNCLELNCYWHHLDRNGDGAVDVDLEPLRRLIDEINVRGMFASLSVETYGVGGGQIPAEFWNHHPDAVAIDSFGEQVKDTEYDYCSIVPSLFSPDYLKKSRAYIRDLTSKLDYSKILYFETTVEPQYMGSRDIDYSVHAKTEYNNWVKQNNIAGAPAFPATFPVEKEFVLNPVWNRFRAEWLGGWVSGDAQVFRDAAGADAWIASDYLDANEESMTARCGEPLEFLRNLSGINIIQVNWHWHYGFREPNSKAYERVRRVMAETGRPWAIAEHMTINGTDYYAKEMDGLLRNTIHNSTRFGWEFVDIAADPDSATVPEGKVQPGNFKPAHFSVYDKNWEPKPAMAVVDKQWRQWMDEVYDGVYC